MLPPSLPTYPVDVRFDAGQRLEEELQAATTSRDEAQKERDRAQAEAAELKQRLGEMEDGAEAGKAASEQANRLKQLLNKARAAIKARAQAWCRPHAPPPSPYPGICRHSTGRIWRRRGPRWSSALPLPPSPTAWCVQ